MIGAFYGWSVLHFGDTIGKLLTVHLAFATSLWLLTFAYLCILKNKTFLKNMRYVIVDEHMFYFFIAILFVIHFIVCLIPVFNFILVYNITVLGSDDPEFTDLLSHLDEYVDDRNRENKCLAEINGITKEKIKEAEKNGKKLKQIPAYLVFKDGAPVAAFYTQEEADAFVAHDYKMLTPEMFKELLCGDTNENNENIY